MAAFDSLSLSRSRERALQGFAFTLVLSLIGTLSVKVGNQVFGFAMLPVLGAFLWPRLADPFASVISLFLVGILNDLMGEGVIGLSSVTFIFIFILLRPDLRDARLGVLPLWLRWTVLSLLIVLAQFLLGRVFLGYYPSLGQQLRLALMAAICFPVIYNSRNWLRRIFSDPDDLGYIL